MELCTTAAVKGSDIGNKNCKYIKLNNLWCLINVFGATNPEKRSIETRSVDAIAISKI